MLIAISAFLQGVAPAAAPLEYNRDVRPILAENCFACHGPDSAARKADLRLDRRDDAVAAKAIIPGKPDDSAVLGRILSGDADEVMPPPESHKKLTDAQKDLLRRWIAQGAEYQPHWSFLPAKRPAPPAVKNEAWVRNPIDRFILAELEKQGLTPAPEADRRTLARRLSLDLVGLPPEPALVEAFVSDAAPDAYEKYVDLLLKTPQWGEHRGRYWLDAARFADTHGIHFDNYREMWAYRDWVIQAFNRNLPFDQFTIEQLAGDLLPNRTLEQQVATGFNRCNITTNEGGVIAEEYLVLYNRDRTETTSQVFLGLTAGCAVCHDHKFDPLSQREFYEMAAFFNNTTQGAMDGNIKDTPPIVTVPRMEDRARWDALPVELTAAQKALDDRRAAARLTFDAALKDGRLDPAALVPADGLVFHAPLNEGSGNTVGYVVKGEKKSTAFEKPLDWEPGHVADLAYKRTADTVAVPEAADFDGATPFAFGAWIKLPAGNATGAVAARMEDGPDHRGWDLYIENGRLAMHLVHKWPGDGLKVVDPAALPVGKWTHVFVTYDGSKKAGGVALYVDGERRGNVAVHVDALKGTTASTAPFKIGQRNGSSPVTDVGIQDLRVYGRAVSADDVAKIRLGARNGYLAKKPADKRTPAEADELFGWWVETQDAEFADRRTKLTGLKGEESAIKGRGTIAHVMSEKPTAPVAFILHRGEYDQRRDQVAAGTPAVLPRFPDAFPRDRLGFARWLLTPEQPLTARVTVNRFWQEVFGTGLVRTAGDFGVTGEAPSNPELLDWLAVDFRENGWDMKRFFKQLVTSAAYRQSALVTPEKLEKDRDGRLLSRGPRFRLDAEMIRDYGLAASGLLVRTVGGPSVKPYQPEGVWEAVAMIGSNTRDYRADDGDRLYRRSMYTFWKRSAPPASMEILNAPNRETCVVRRDRTNTPLQALVTLNDPQGVEAARVLAARALAEGGATAETRLDYVAQRLLARPLRAEERLVAVAVFNDLAAHYASNPDDAKKLLAVGVAKTDPALDPTALAAWTMVVNQFMNLDEVLCK
ncbi:MAG: DUF1553 domain-containing protein [Planctomycetia bacterium]